MCIILKSITESPKVAESDMITYKILEVVEDKATGKESYYSPISINRLQYNVGELYTESIGKTEDVHDLYYLPMEKTYEYAAKTTTELYSYRDLDVAVTFLQIIENGVIALSKAKSQKKANTTPQTKERKLYLTIL